jgi:4'-phosphopantetheinyl transferase
MGIPVLQTGKDSADRVMTEMGMKQLYLWCAYPRDLSTESVVETSLSMLSKDERAHWKSLQFDRHRCEYLATRTLVRTALSHYYPLAPAAWQFQLNSHGKPRVDPDCGLHFNLSNSLDLVACLIAKDAEVGIDLESYARAKDIADLAEDVFSPLELSQLEGLGDLERLDRALSLWTLKEAFIKARGAGLSLPLKKLSFRFEGTKGIRLEVDPCLCDEPDRHWRFCLLDHAGHRIALMADQTTISELQLWELQPLLAPPKRLHDSDVTWFPSSS